jgi:hypothetical protein
MWAFIIGVVGVDIVFAYENRATFMEWESNPFVRALVSWSDLETALCFRALSVLFGLLLAVSFSNVRIRLTVIVFLMHLYVAYVYLSLLK